jgi:hypothetical protein
MYILQALKNILSDLLTDLLVLSYYSVHAECGYKPSKHTFQPTMKEIMIMLPIFAPKKPTVTISYNEKLD